MQRHARAVDGTIAGLFAGFAVLTVVASAVFNERTPLWDLPNPGWWTIPTLICIAASTVALLFRRSRPLWGVVLAAALVLVPLPVPSLAEPTLSIFALYAVGAYRGGRTAWLSFTLIAGCSALSTALGAAVPGVWSVIEGETGHGVAALSSTLVVSTIFLLSALLLGMSIGNRRRYLDALIDRAGQLARERDQRAEIAAAEERGRIAGEMHDVLAHSMSVMIALSEGAAATAATRPADAAATMSTVAETGRRSLAELRRLLGVLGEPGQAERRPQPGAAQLGELVAGFRTAGLRVELSSRGEPGADAALGLTVYRIMQESLTNALRYADGAPASADIDWGVERVEITVLDRGTGRRTAQQGAGRGLLGMRERVALFGGSVETGPAEGGGWRVRAVLPRDGGRDDAPRRAPHPSTAADKETP
ncbi:sensor histidine kinase [Schumannella luteola]|uniref:sensor histidine kinase n=1 Tax=Schumannella luteola TaxID=472059 RepID=UPI003CCD929C